jgi:dipeptidase
MDLLRLALERARTAREALDVITTLLAEHGQGGGCGYRNKKFRYHNSFIIADTAEAWVLETAGPHWAAQKVRGIRTISNSLSIGQDFDLVSPGAYPLARSHGWCKSAADFDFARSFGDPFYSALAGGTARSACTASFLSTRKDRLSLEDFVGALSDHAGRSPSSGWRMNMACAHASWWPARQSGQTTGSIVSRLSADGSTHWLTGTSSPCLSVFKPVTLGGDLLATGPVPGAGYDAQSLFWRHERLHRLVITGYEEKKAAFDAERAAFQIEVIADASAKHHNGLCSEIWDRHRELVPEWVSLVERSCRGGKKISLFTRYWAKQEGLDRSCDGGVEGDYLKR